MTEHVCFITCVSNEELYQECLNHIHALDIPEGIIVETVAVRNANSMTAGYNSAIANHAKYKVYLHQDTFVVNKSFLYNILEIFQSNADIGMIGVIGSEIVPANGIWWQGKKCFGMVLENRGAGDKLLSFRKIQKKYQSVQAVDGLIMVTQYDIPWREDIFDAWHFYDISQCMEFIRNGYQVVVPDQQIPWCLHNCGEVINTDGFDNYRKKFIIEYLGQHGHEGNFTGSTPIIVDNYYSSSRDDILRNIPCAPKRVLELGCARGNFGRALKKKYDCYVVGVDMVEQVAIEAKGKIDAVIIADINKMDFLNDVGQGYDLVVANDLLEHLVDPWSLVKKVRALLNDGGYFVASIPNVRAVSKNLFIKGKWEYQDAGILDRTHLRFFSKGSMLRMFTDSGYSIKSITGITAPRNIYHKVMLVLFRDLRTPQYCIVAQK